MNKISETNFPDPKFLNNLIEHLQKRANSSQKPLEKLLTFSGVAMNWVADYIIDQNILWSKETLLLDSLYLTGTNPEWNKVIIDQCHRNPQVLRKLLNSDPNVLKLFSTAKFDETPILVRYDDDNYKVLDGMHRTIAAIRSNKKEIQAFVARINGLPQSQCEPHVVYDFLRAYQRGLYTNRQQLVDALRFLRHSYVNVDDLLRNRFGPSLLSNAEIQSIIQEVLSDR